MIEMTNLYLGVLYESQTSTNMTIFRFLAEKELIFRSRLIIHISQSQVHSKGMKNDSYLYYYKIEFYLSTRISSP